MEDATRTSLAALGGGAADINVRTSALPRQADSECASEKRSTPNMQAVKAFYDDFHDKGWERFNSGKRCCVAYARIQTRRALVSHFQNSSLMHEDKCCRPVLLNLDGETPETEPFPPPRRGAGPGPRRGICRNAVGLAGGTAVDSVGGVGLGSRDSTESPQSMHLLTGLSGDGPPVGEPR
jgi:hypothetical protein